MAGSRNLSSDMALNIRVNKMDSVKTIGEINDKLSELTQKWKAEQAAAKANGDAVAAQKAKYKGLGEVLDLQKGKLEGLKARQASLKKQMDESGHATKEQKTEYAALTKAITSTTNKIASLSNQQKRAKNAADYAASGLKELKNQYYVNTRAVAANVEKLKLQGKEFEAQKAQLNGYKSTVENLTKQQSAMEKLVQKTADDYGKDSTIYKRRKTELDQITSATIKARKQTEDYRKSIKVLGDSGTRLHASFNNLIRKIAGVSSAEKKDLTTTKVLNRALKTLTETNARGFAELSGKIHGVFSGTFLSSALMNGINSANQHLHLIYENGMAAARAGAAMQASFKGIGMSQPDIEAMTKEVGELKAGSNLSAGAVHNLQLRFYDLTHDAGQTEAITKGVASLSDQLKLSQPQAEAFANGLSRIEGSGKLTAQSLQRLEKTAPGISSALQRASGMSQQSFDQLVSSGKMTADQFNDILAKASKDWDKNSKAFESTGAGALHKLQQDWTSTQAAFAKPLINVQATGLMALDRVLESPGVQNGFKAAGQGLANIVKSTSQLLTNENISKISTIVGDLVHITGLISLNVWEGFKDAVSNIAYAFDGVTRSTKALQDPLGAVQGVLNKLYSYIQYHEGNITSLMSSLGGIVGILSKSVWNVFAKAIDDISNAFSKAGKGVINLKDPLGAVDYIVTGIYKFVAEHQKDINKVTMSLYEIVKVLASAVWGAFKETIQVLNDLFGGVSKSVGGASGALSGFANVMKHIADYLKANQKPLTQTLSNLVKIAGIAAQHTWQIFAGIIKSIGVAFGAVGKHTSALDSLAKITDALAKNQTAVKATVDTILSIWAVRKTAGVIIGIGQMIKGLREAAKQAKDLWHALKLLPKRFVLKFKDDFNKAKERLIKLRDATVDAARKMKDKMSIAASTMKTKISSAALTMKAKMSGAFVSIRAGAMAAGMSIKAMIAAMGPIGIAFTALSALASVFSWFYNNDPKFQHWVDGIRNAFTKTIVNATNKSVGAIQKFVGHFTKYLGKALEFVKKNWKTIVGFLVNPFGESIKLITRHSKTFDRLVNNVKKFFTKAIQNTVKDNQRKLSDFGRFFTNIFKNQLNFLKRNWKTIGLYIVNPIVGAIVSLYKQNKSFRNWCNSMVKSAANMWKTMSNWASTGVKWMIGHINALPGAGARAIGNLVNNMVNGLKNSGKALGNAMVSLLNWALNPFNSFVNAIRRGLKWIFNRIGQHPKALNHSWSASLPHYATGKQADDLKEHLGVVNDAVGQHYREMFTLPTGELGVFPKKRNIVMPIVPGMSILDGEKSHEIAKKLNIKGYASGLDREKTLEALKRATESRGSIGSTLISLAPQMNISNLAKLQGQPVIAPVERTRSGHVVDLMADVMHGFQSQDQAQQQMNQQQPQPVNNANGGGSNDQMVNLLQELVGQMNIQNRLTKAQGNFDPQHQGVLQAKRYAIRKEFRTQF